MRPWQKKLKRKDMQDSKQVVIDALKKVQDPELSVDIYSLGLIYEIDIIKEKSIRVLYTLTSPMCPAGPKIQDDMRMALVDIGYQETELELTFDPPWQAPEELRVMLGLPT